ncbi:MAG: hypothetical protein IPH84_14930 [Bacteroidales bacterium]|nr:hypothetical protein [Bacteroidales bacterium]
MKQHVHQHIISELQQNTRTDIIFILTSIFLNLLTLAINSGLVKDSRTDEALFVVMLIFVALIFVVNVVVIIGLLKGKETRMKLINGLLSMYEDENVAKYYDKSLLGNYNIRYRLFILVVLFTGMIAIIIPFVMR